MTLEFKHNSTAHKAPSKTKLGYASRFLTGVAVAAEIRISKIQSQAMFSLSMEERK